MPHFKFRNFFKQRQKNKETKNLQRTFVDKSKKPGDKKTTNSQQCIAKSQGGTFEHRLQLSRPEIG